MRPKPRSWYQHCQPFQGPQTFRPGRLNWAPMRPRSLNLEAHFLKCKDSEIDWILSESDQFGRWAPQYPRDWVLFVDYYPIRWVLKDLQRAPGSFWKHHYQNQSRLGSTSSWRTSRKRLCKAYKFRGWWQKGGRNYDWSWRSCGAIVRIELSKLVQQGIRSVYIYQTLSAQRPATRYRIQDWIPWSSEVLLGTKDQRRVIYSD